MISEKIAEAQTNYAFPLHYDIMIFDNHCSIRMESGVFRNIFLTKKRLQNTVQMHPKI